MMKVSPAYYIILYIILMFFQITVFGNVALFGYATPFLFIYFIIKLPANMSPNLIMTLAFLTGLMLDIFFSTPGQYAFSATLVAFMRKSYISLILQRDEESVAIIPSVKSLGQAPFAIYVLLVVFTFALTIFIIQAFTIFNSFKLILQILLSTLVTYILIIVLDRVSTK
ncbi:MAG: rod shape-determining protein MreD [Bacteroidales bacterium]